jgi:glutamyl-tRNA reductase
MIGVVGLSHKTAPIEIREKLSLDKSDIAIVSHRLLETTQIEEMVIISTCNRTEIYFKAPKCCASGAFSIVRRVLNRHTGTDESLDAHLYKYQHEDAVRHLFKVVSSLESMVLGEYQIVSQIKDAYETAKQNRTVGKILKRLFNKALETGKEVRTQTDISKGAFSVSYAAVEKCYEHHKDLSHKKILLIGAGETGELVIKNLHNKGCKHITVTNRTLDRAEELALRYQGRAVPFADMEEQVMEADIVVSSVTTKSAILNCDNVVRNGHTHPQLFIDLGVPRNIDNSVACLPQVTLVNIDHLHQVVSGNKDKKQAFVQAANDIIDIKTCEFIDWLNVQNLAPAIQTIISTIKTTSTQELSVFKKFHGDDDLQLMNKYGDHLSEKLIKALVKNLKQISDNGRKTEYIKVVNDLFNPSND